MKMQKYVIMLLLCTMMFIPATQAQSCSSGGTGAEMSFNVTNNANQAVTAVWINYECGEVEYLVVAPGQTGTQGTFDGHEWILRLADGSNAEQFVAAAGQTEFVIGSATAPQPPPPPTPANTTTVQPATGSVSELIIFESYRNGSWDIYTMNPDGSNLIQITSDPADNATPIFSPDGTQVVFTSTRDGNPETYIMNADGSNQRRLTNRAGDDFNPVFSPDGTRIASRGVDPVDGDAEIFTMNIDGSDVRQLTQNTAADILPEYSPDGSRIVFRSDQDGNHEIYAMNTDGSNLIRLTNNPNTDSEPMYSPDGSRILFSSDRDGNRDIYIMNSDGSNVQRLTNNPAIEKNATFSPDGTQVLFSRDSGNEFYNLIIINVDGTGERQITTSEFSDVNPDWIGNSTGNAGTAPAPTGNTQTTTTQNTGSGITNSTTGTGAEIRFLWSDNSFYMYNPGATFRVSPLRFESLNSSGQPSGQSFEGSRWANFYHSVERNKCEIIRIRVDANPLNPDICGNYNALTWVQPEEGSSFWTDAGFRIMFSGNEIGRCASNTGECTIRLP